MTPAPPAPAAKISNKSTKENGPPGGTARSIRNDLKTERAYLPFLGFFFSLAGLLLPFAITDLLMCYTHPVEKLRYRRAVRTRRGLYYIIVKTNCNKNLSAAVQDPRTTLLKYVSPNRSARAEQLITEGSRCQYDDSWRVLRPFDCWPPACQRRIRSREFARR